jgi:hypothetical protein
MKMNQRRMRRRGREWSRKVQGAGKVRMGGGAAWFCSCFAGLGQLFLATYHGFMTSTNFSSL